MPEIERAVIDGRDALAYVIIRPSETAGVTVEAAANGISKKAAAYVLRSVADAWDGGGGEQ
jgi:hypothetical protein